MISRLGFYISFAWRSVVLRRPAPLLIGIVLTGRCNLHCGGCRVANTGPADMTWEQLTGRMQAAWQQGFRELYFTGGEPLLWRDGEHTLADAIRAAKEIGFFHVHVYTNGTRGLNIPADLVWVSIDGLPGTYDRRRGDHFARVEQSVREGGHPKTAVVYVIDRNTAGGIEPFLEWMRATRLPVVGVMFYFHTPYYGMDELYLSAAERAPVIDWLLGCIRAGHPLMNSRAGLLALKSGKWQRRIPAVHILDSVGEYVCCRAEDAVCPDCGYAACTELAEVLRLRPSAILGMLRFL